VTTFGQMLRERRRELGLSQESVADRAQLHRTHISLIERGLRRSIALETLVRLSWALETTPGALLDRYAGSDDAPGGPKP
jgi:transcriptional regulator with XRE-family HTH domain